MSDTAKREATKKAAKANGQRPAAPAVSASAEEWRATTYRRAVERAPERQPAFTTSSEIEVQPLYTAEDLRDWDPAEQLGYPGEYPYTRGIQPTMYRGRLWTMRQYAGYATAEESNKRYRYLLEHGTTGLSVAFDLPTQMGYDADHPLAEGEVGKVGVSISSVEDMRTLFDGIPLEKITTSMTINATAAILLALYIAVAREQGADVRKLSGTVQNDILKEYIARGTYIYPPTPSMRIITDLFRYCAAEVPRWNTISISGYHIREAGCTAAQEIGFTLANGIAYVRAALDAGLDVDAFARAAVLLLQWPQQLLRGGRQVPRGAAHVGEDHARALRRERRALAAAALPHADGRLYPDGSTARQQHRAHGLPGDGGGARRHAIAAHQQQGRGAGTAQRGVGAAGAAHAAGSRLRDRRGRHG